MVDLGLILGVEGVFCGLKTEEKNFEKRFALLKGELDTSSKRCTERICEC